MISYIQINKVKFIETRLILQQISLNLDLFGRNEGNFKQKKKKKILFQGMLSSKFVNGGLHLLTHSWIAPYCYTILM